MKYNYMGEGYFNPKVKKDSVSIEDTKSRIERIATATAEKFISDIRSNPNTVIMQANADGQGHTFEYRTSNFYDGNRNLENGDPVANLFEVLVWKMCTNDFGGSNGSNLFRVNYTKNLPGKKFVVSRECEPEDEILFEIDADIIMKFRAIYSYLTNYCCPFGAWLVNLSYDEVVASAHGGSVCSEVRFWLKGYYEGYKDYNDCSYIDDFKDYLILEIERLTGDSSNSTVCNINDYQKKHFGVVRPILKNEFEKPSGARPSLMNILKNIITDNGKMIDLLKEEFELLSDVISKQIPVNIKIDPVIEFNSENIIRMIGDILHRFPDTFLEGTTVHQENFRIKL